jgi:hypothetical protein
MTKKKGGDNKLLHSKSLIFQKLNDTQQIKNVTLKKDVSVEYALNESSNEKKMYSKKEAIFTILAIKETDFNSIKLNNDMFNLDVLKTILNDFNKGNDNDNFLNNNDYFDEKYQETFKQGGTLSLKNYENMDDVDPIKVQNASSDLQKYISYINTLSTSLALTARIIDYDTINSIVTNYDESNPNIIDFTRKYPNLVDYILTNNIQHDANVNIPVQQKCVIISLDNTTFSDDGNRGNIINYDYKYRDYNELIVKDFEHNFFDPANLTYLETLLDQHNAFIRTLSDIEKCVINDYTNQNANVFYGKYIRGDPTWRKGPDAYKFGDAYLPQIIEYITKIYTIYLNYFDDWNSEEKTQFETKHKFISTINNNYNRDINNFIITNKSKSRSPDNAESVFKDTLSVTDWNNILNKFEFDVTAIIKKAPKPKQPIYCYRGVSSHHIVQKDSRYYGNDDVLLKCYYTAQLSSFSFDYNAAYYFYTEYTNSITTVKPNARLYRTTIMPGCDMLFANALSIFPNEFEIIIPPKAIILDGNGWNNSQKVQSHYRDFQTHFTNNSTNIRYNNRNNEIGLIGLPDDKLQTFDIVIIGNPPITRSFSWEIDTSVTDSALLQ